MCVTIGDRARASSLVVITLNNEACQSLVCSLCSPLSRVRAAGEHLQSWLTKYESSKAVWALVKDWPKSENTIG